LLPSEKMKRRIEYGVLIILLVLPFSGVINVNILSLFLIYAIFALSVDFAWGYSGLLSFGQAAFFGIGAYTAALIKDIPFLNLTLFSLPLAIIITGLAAYLFSSFLFGGKKGVTGVYFSLITLATAFLLEKLANNLKSVGGYNGITGVPYLDFGAFDLARGIGQYLFVFAILILCYLLFRMIIHSNMGIIMQGIRDNEVRVSFLGYDIARTKIFIFTLTSMVSGLAGMLFAANQGYVSPSILGFGFSTEVLIWVAIGGRNTLLGPVLGAVIMSWLSYSLSGVLANAWFLILGILIVIFVIFFPKGIVGALFSYLGTLEKKQRNLTLKTPNSAPLEEGKQ
jgi:branched-chain amino acid transport system permease protein